MWSSSASCGTPQTHEFQRLGTVGGLDHVHIFQLHPEEPADVRLVVGDENERPCAAGPHADHGRRGWAGGRDGSDLRRSDFPGNRHGRPAVEIGDVSAVFQRFEFSRPES